MAKCKKCGELYDEDTAPGRAAMRAHLHDQHHVDVDNSSPAGALCDYFLW